MDPSSRSGDFPSLQLELLLEWGGRSLKEMFTISCQSRKGDYNSGNAQVPGDPTNLRPRLGKNLGVYLTWYRLITRP